MPECVAEQECRSKGIAGRGRPTLSVVTAAYNEEENLPALHARLREVLDPLGLGWEWIVVDDHSADGTFAVLAGLARAEPGVRALRLARNYGSHTALSCGLNEARGDCAVVLAADLQDPPELIPKLLDRWSRGDQVVWAVRARRDGESAATLGFARLYYLLMRRVVGMKELPATGSDFFLIDRRVLDAFRRFREGNTSVFALITWMGFRQSQLAYDKQARRRGRSGWTLGKKVKLVIDSVTAFTYLPIRLMSSLGFATAGLGFLYACWVVVNALAGSPVQGWSSLMVVVLLLGGLQMLMLGILGEYLWRAFDEARNRPRYLIEATTDEDGAGPATAGRFAVAERGRA